MKTFLLTAVFGCLFSWAQCQGTNDPSRDLQIHLPDFTYLNSDNFRIYLENRSSLNETTLELLETVYDRYVQLMLEEGFIPEHSNAFTWLCFNSRQSYEAYSKKADGFVPQRLNSYYSAKTNCVAILIDNQDNIKPDRSNGPPNDSHQISGSDFVSGSETEQELSPNRMTRAIVTHELIHQLAFNTGLQKRGVEYPLWVSEGMATAFEYLFEQPGNKDNRYRLNTVIELRQQDRLIPLEAFVSMSRLSWPRLTDSETYAQCWAFFNFLWKHRKPQLKEYLSQAAARPAGQVSPALLKQDFVDCFGPVGTLESDWMQWLLSK